MRNGVDKVDCGWIKDSVEQQVKGFGIFSTVSGSHSRSNEIQPVFSKAHQTDDLFL